MTNTNFAIAVNKFFFYAMNYSQADITYPTLFNGNVTRSLPDFFLAFDKGSIEHLFGKFNSAYDKYGSRGAVMAFYGELDGTNRYKLLSWINENYKMRDDFGISIPKEEVVAR